MYCLHHVLLLCLFETIVFFRVSSSSEFELSASEDTDCDVIAVLSTESPAAVGAKKSFMSDAMDFYKFTGFSRKFDYAFLDVYVEVNITEYKLYKGENCSEVEAAYERDKTFLGLFNHPNWMQPKYLEPFSTSVIGIDTNEAYEIWINVIDLNMYRFFIFIGGILLFLKSRALVHNEFFYYSSSTILGPLCSMFLIIFFVYRFVPKKRFSLIAIIIGGWSSFAYLFYAMSENFFTFSMRHQNFILSYFGFSAFAAFAIFYRFGPPTNVRTIRLVQWLLQFIAVFAIYLSCQLRDISILTIIVLFFYMALGKQHFRSVRKRFWKYFSRNNRRLLTREEYMREGNEQTRKAIEDLRGFCLSPKSNVWKVASNVHDPRSFIAGSRDHVSEVECSLYENEVDDYSDYSDDSGQDDFVASNRTRAGMDTILHLSGKKTRTLTDDDLVRGIVLPSINSNDNFEESDSDEDNKYMFEWPQLDRSLPLKRRVPSDRKHNSHCTSFQ